MRHSGPGGVFCWYGVPWAQSTEAQCSEGLVLGAGMFQGHIANAAQCCRPIVVSGPVLWRHSGQGR